jgi:hypothetical protein
MDRTREPGKKQEEGISARITSACLPLFLGALALLSGCNTWQKLTGSGPTAQAVTDPLVGGDPAQKATSTAAASSNRSKSSAIPAIPASSSSSSNAAMVVGQPLPGGKTLAIDDKSKNTGNWQGSAPAAGPATGTLTNGPGAVQLQRPEAMVDPVQRPMPVPVPLAPASPVPAVAGPSPDQLQTQLKQRGVTFQHQEQVAGGVKFTCAVPNRHNPDINRFYEATASDLPGAIQAVLQQIDAQQGTSQ